MREIEKVIPNDFDLNTLTAEDIEAIDYLSNFVWEVLRKDSATPASANKIALVDVDLKGLVIKKGTNLKWNFFGIHYNEKQWQSPEDFIPEWFDPLSPYYKRPDGGARSKCAFSSFLQGSRACPG